MIIHERTCLICKKKNEKKNLFRLAKIGENKYIFDEKQKYQSRGSYVCKNPECLKRLAKHKKIKMSSEDLFKMANNLKKDTKDYLNILKAMKNSGELAFGMNMVLEDINHTHFLAIANDIGEKNEKKLMVKAQELGINYVYCGTKIELGDIFGKDEISVIAIKSKKMARGLID